MAWRHQGHFEYRSHGETISQQPENTDPVGKSSIRPRRKTSEIIGHKLRIPTLWGKNTDLQGKDEPLDRWLRTAGYRCWWAGYRLTAAFWRKLRADQCCLPITDPGGRDFRPCGESIPTPEGDSYRPCGERIPILSGDITDLSGVDYRPHGEICQPKVLEIHTFASVWSIYMMLCLCLMFCLVNREVMRG